MRPSSNRKKNWLDGWATRPIAAMMLDAESAVAGLTAGKIEAPFKVIGRVTRGL